MICMSIVCYWYNGTHTCDFMYAHPYMYMPLCIGLFV